MRALIPLPSLLCAALVLMTGCESDSSDDLRARQDAALKDPFGYGPDADKMIDGMPTSPDRSDITGGGVGHYDKDAVKRDWNSFWDP